jgi:nuclear pore complex protein Nup155
MALRSQCFTFNSEFDTFAEQPDTITSVTLVKPKSGVFVDDIKQIMVVCTTTSIILIGVGVTFEQATGESVRKALKLYATDMVLSTKNVAMSSIVGTETGRIFMAGSDGNLYELDYASAESWFSAKTYLKNHSVSLVSSFLPSFMSVTSEGMLSVFEFSS